MLLGVVEYVDERLGHGDEEHEGLRLQEAPNDRVFDNVVACDGLLLEDGEGDNDTVADQEPVRKMVTELLKEKAVDGVRETDREALRDALQVWE